MFEHECRTETSQVTFVCQLVKVLPGSSKGFWTRGLFRGSSTMNPRTSPSLAWKIPFNLLDVQFKDECEVTSSILEFCVLQNGQNVMWLFFFKSSATDPPFWRWLSFSFISLARPEENIWFIWYEAISGQDCNSRTIAGTRLEPDNHPEPEWTLLY